MIDPTLAERVDREQHNLRLALRWSMDAGLSEAALQLAIGMWHSWHLHGRYAEGRAWFAELFATPDAPTSRSSAARPWTAPGSWRTAREISVPPSLCCGMV
jgi:hypothetical protein